MKLVALPQEFSIIKVKEYTPELFGVSYFFVGGTPTEKSCVCPTDSVPACATERSDGWRGFFIEGTLDFSLVGVLSGIANVLAEKKIGILALSTYDTDYIFVKKEKFSDALASLRKAGYETTE